MPGETLANGSLSLLRVRVQNEASMRPPPHHPGLMHPWGLRTPRSRMRRVRSSAPGSGVSREPSDHSSLERVDFGVDKIQSSAFPKEPRVARAWEATPGKRKREAPDARHPGDQPRWRPSAEGKTQPSPGRAQPLLHPPRSSPPAAQQRHPRWNNKATSEPIIRSERSPISGA